MYTDVLDVLSRTIDEIKHEHSQNCPSADEGMNTLWSIHRMEYYLTMKRDDVLINVTTWLNLPKIMLSESDQIHNKATCGLIPLR